MKESLVIGLSSWIIQDGNYGDFKQGDHAAFAVEFYAPTALSVAETESGRVARLENVDANLYRVFGKSSSRS